MGQTKDIVFLISYGHTRQVAHSGANEACKVDARFNEIQSCIVWSGLMTQLHTSYYNNHDSTGRATREHNRVQCLSVRLSLYLACSLCTRTCHTPNVQKESESVDFFLCSIH